MEQPYKIICGDSLTVTATFEPNSIDAIVTDPPYGLSFMGKHWDHGVPGVAFWTEALRVLKPGGYLLAFGGSRTYHRLATAIEDAGFEIRDQIMWIYGSGFPKSRDIGKDIEKLKVGGIKNLKQVGTRKGLNNEGGTQGFSYQKEYVAGVSIGGKQVNGEIPVYEITNDREGFGTALKPAHEPIVMARKPLEKGLTVAQNVLKWGTGAINVDGCRVELNGEKAPSGSAKRVFKSNGYADKKTYGDNTDTSPLGRFPANVTHDGSDEVEAEFAKSGERKSCTAPSKADSQGTIFGGSRTQGNLPMDSGTASRFFYCAKASKQDRNEGCGDLAIGQATGGGIGDYLDDVNSASGKYGSEKAPSQNHHPTVKPTDLMRYLCRMVTPPKGTVLDMFNGSGSTGKGAVLEGFEYIGIELDPEYCEIAEKRIGAIFSKEPLFQK